MTHRILLFAGVRAATGLDHIDLEIEDGDTVHVILERLQRRLPDSAGLIQISRLAVDGSYLTDEQKLGTTVGELALIPPVSGG